MAMELAEKHDNGLATQQQTQAHAGFDPQNLEQLWKLCGHLVTTGFLPEAIKTPAQATAIILAGKELGMGLMESLRSLNIIKGKISLAADAQLGLMLKAGIKVKWVEKSNTRAALELTRSGMDPATFEFTLEDAQRAKLAGENWSKYPAAMLRARVISAAAKAYAPDVLHGAYDPDELAPSVAQVQAHEEKKTRTAAVKERLANGGATVTVEPPPVPVDSNPQH